MSYADRARQARKNYSVILMYFIKMFSNDRDRLFCFFEGEDSKYYESRIRNTIQENDFLPIECHGKKNVIKIWDVIHDQSDYKNARIAYFVDRDFDDQLSINMAKDIFETPCYSIENLYTSESCVRRIFRSEFKLLDLDMEDTTLQECLDLYKITQSQFHTCMTELNAWIIAHREKERMLSTSVDLLNLKNTETDAFVSINLGKVVKKYDITNINDIFKNALLITGKEVTMKTFQFHYRRKGEVFRGKYEIEFLRIFLIKLREDRCKTVPSFFKKEGRCSLQVSQKNIISELSHYADTPSCLISYLMKFKIN